jgi:hypothetical protein
MGLPVALKTAEIMKPWLKGSALSGALVILLLLFSVFVLAHPEDEFCTGEEMDPLLCAQLSALDRAADTSGYDALPPIELDRSPLATALLYTKLGVEHILPMGLDHLAFVLALVLSATALRPLLIHISVFTLAHSVTLILGVLEIVSLNGVWVEVAIAFSIMFVALENLFFKLSKYWRPIIIFAFGLLHGLGFAGALSELGIPANHFVSALLGFNVGVEIGQVSFGLLAFMLISIFAKRDWFARVIQLPGNLMIALIGGYWLFERLM